MIVVDTNVLAALLLPGPLTEAAERLLSADPDWNAPTLWRSELRSVLATQVRAGVLTFAQAMTVQREAEDLLRQGEHEVDSGRVLDLARQSGCTAYDCEFVEVALRLGAPLHTRDKQLLRKFAEVARRFG